MNRDSNDRIHEIADIILSVLIVLVLLFAISYCVHKAARSFYTTVDYILNTAKEQEKIKNE